MYLAYETSVDSITTKMDANSASWPVYYSAILFALPKTSKYYVCKYVYIEREVYMFQ